MRPRLLQWNIWHLEKIERIIAVLRERSPDILCLQELSTNSEAKPAVSTGELIKALSLRLKHAGPDFSQNTWTTKPFEYNGFKENELNWRLDYVFSTADVAVLKSAAVHTEVSDHLPLLVELEV